MKTRSPIRFLMVVDSIEEFNLIFGLNLSIGPPYYQGGRVRQILVVLSVMIEMKIHLRDTQSHLHMLSAWSELRPEDPTGSSGWLGFELFPVGRSDPSIGTSIGRSYTVSDLPGLSQISAFSVYHMHVPTPGQKIRPEVPASSVWICSGAGRSDACRKIR